MYFLAQHQQSYLNMNISFNRVHKGENREIHRKIKNVLSKM